MVWSGKSSSTATSGRLPCLPRVPWSRATRSDARRASFCLVALDTFGIVCAVTLAPLLARQLLGTSVHRPPLHLIVVGSIVYPRSFRISASLWIARTAPRRAARPARLALAIAALIALRFCLGSSVSLSPWP